MNKIETNPAAVIVTTLFVLTWIALGIAGLILIYLRPDAAFKKKWFPRFVMLTGGLFVFFVAAISVAGTRSIAGLGVLFIVVPAVVLISYLNMKFTRFCDKCGATIFAQNWFSPIRFCSKCGAELDSSKPAQVDEL